MKVTGYRSLTTVHDWGRPLGDANGRVPSGITAVPVLILETDSELEGIGLGPHTDLERVLPAVLGEDPRAVGTLYDRMLDRVFKTGHQGTVYGSIAAIDMALWDLKAKRAGEPLWRTLGGRDPFVPGYASGLDLALDEAELSALYRRFADAGFTGAKVKGGLDAASDVRRLQLVAELLGGSGQIPWCALDVNEVWNRAQAMRYLRTVAAEVDLAWIEEPLRRWDAEGMAALRQATGTPIATGENLTGVEQFRPLFEARSVDIVQTGSVWGISHFLRVATIAHHHGLVVSPVGYDANPLASAATAVPNHLVLEVQELSMPVGLDVDQEFADGGIRLGESPGLGIVVDERAITARRESGPWADAWGQHQRPERAGRTVTIGQTPRS